MSLEQAAAVAAALAGGLTGYVLLRTVYIWYFYLRSAARSGDAKADTLVGQINALLRRNPPPAFPSADLPWATAILGVVSLVACVLGLWAVAAKP